MCVCVCVCVARAGEMIVQVMRLCVDCVGDRPTCEMIVRVILSVGSLCTWCSDEMTV